MTRANALTAACIRWLTVNGYFCWRQNNHATYDPKQGAYRSHVGLKGIPDILAVAPNGRFVGVEIKVGKDRLSPDQRAFQAAVQKQGATYIVVKESIDELIEGLK